MHLLSVIKRDVASKVSGEVVSRGILLCFFFYVARKLGTASFGELGVAISTTYIMGVIFLDPGLNLSTIQLLVQDPEGRRRIAGSILLLKLLLFAPMLLCLWGLDAVLGSGMPARALLLIAAIYTLVTAILEYLSSVTNAYHRMDIEAWLKISNRVAMVLLGAMALLVGGTSAVLWAMTVATLASCVLAIVVIRRKLLSFGLAWHPDVMKSALRKGLPIAGTLIVGTIYLKWDLLVLSYFHIAKQEIGWYAGAFKILEAFSALPSLLGAALFPLILQLRSKDPAALDRLLSTTTRVVLLVSIPVAATICLFSRQIMSLVYGNSYLPGAKALAILVWCIVPISLYFYLMFVNIAMGHAKHNLLAGCVALGAGIIANALLVPRLGYLGAAWSALIANSSFAVLATWRVCSLFQRAHIPPMILRLSVAGGLMVLVGLYSPVSLVLQFALGISAYLILLLFFGALRGEDLSLFVRMLQLRTQPES